MADYKDGGYTDIDIETKISSLKVKWVSRLLDDNFHPWKIIPNLFFSRVGATKLSSTLTCSYQKHVWLK